MIDSATPSPLSSAALSEPAASFCAVIVLDDTGRITEANTSAHRVWRATGQELIGERFVALFVFDVVSSDPNFLHAQWEALLSVLDREMVLSAQPRGGVPFNVRVQLEKQVGKGGYIATVQPSGGVLPTRAAGPEELSAWSFLQEDGTAGFFDLDFTSGRVHFSAAWKRLLGYSHAEIPDSLEWWHRLIHPEDSAAAPDKLARKLAFSGRGTSRPFSVEFRMLHQRGHWIWMQCTGVQILSELGELERVVGFHLDISERKEIEDTLIANDARLQSLTDEGPLAAFELDFAGGASWYSPAFERLLGHAEGSLPATPASFADALPEEAGGDLVGWLLDRGAGEAVVIEPVRLRAGDGSEVPALVGIHRLVTRRRELQRAVGFAVALPAGLTHSDNSLSPLLIATTLGALAEAVIITDSRGVVRHANAAAVRLLRLPPDALHGHPAADVLQLLNRETQRPSENPVARALAAGTPLPLINDDLLVPNGADPVPVVWTARAAFAPDGTAAGVVIVFRNPEEMTLSPEELVNANRYESLGQLAGGIAHDFNNLLTTVLAALSLAHDKRDYSALGDAEKACLAAKALTRQLLAFAKGDSGTQVVSDPKELLDDAVLIASAASGAEIAVEVAENTDPVLVDRGQMLQVFQNLVVNALEAMPPEPHPARVHLRARNASIAPNQVPGLDAGAYIEFEVRDNGNGIKPEHLEKIFDPFFTTKKHSTGLGLATVLSVVRKHGGQVALDTQIGVGTVFTIYLPRAGPGSDVQARRAASLRFGTGRILFMDDDPRICALTGAMLESLDYTCDLAKDGAEAITLYKRYLNIGRPYDAVIMDLTVVGGMGGEQCFRELRQLDPDVRAIIASGYDNDDMARNYLDQGFCGYLTKPYRAADLGKVLKAVLG